MDGCLFLDRDVLLLNTYNCSVTAEFIPNIQNCELPLFMECSQRRLKHPSSSTMSVIPHVTTRKTVNELSLNLLMENCTKICRHALTGGKKSDKLKGTLREERNKQLVRKL